MKFLSNLDLTRNQLLNAVIQNLATPPQNPKVGQIYFNTAVQELKIYVQTGTDPNTFAWDVVGKEYELVNDILEASGDETSGLKYSRYTTSAEGVLSSTPPVAGTSVLSWSGHLYANRFNDLELTQNTDGFTINGGSTNRRSLIFTGAGNLTLDTKDNKTITTHSNLTVGDATFPNATFTLTSDASASRTLKLGPDGTANHVAIYNGNAALTSEAQLATTRGGTGIGSYAKGDILYSDATDSLAKLSIGSSGQALRVVDGVPEWTTGGSVDETLVLKFDDGTTEDTDLYTFDGSTQKTIDFVGGTDVDLAKTANTITINHADITRNDSTSSSSPGFSGTFDVVDDITTSATGHVTAINVKTVTVPTETTLSITEPTSSTGVFVDDIQVSDHAITVNRNNSTENTVTVGELIVSNAGAGSGDVTIAGNLTVNGTTTTLDTEQVNIKDNIIQINSNQTGTPASSLVSGLEVNRGDEPNFRFVFVEETEDFRLGKVGGTLQPALTRDEVGNLDNNDLLIWDSTNKRAVGSKPETLGIARKVAFTQAISANTSYDIAHNLDTTDLTYSIKAGNYFVYADVETKNANEITLSFGEVNGVTEVRVVIIG